MERGYGGERAPGPIHARGSGRRRSSRRPRAVGPDERQAPRLHRQRPASAGPEADAIEPDRAEDEARREGASRQGGSGEPACGSPGPRRRQRQEARHQDDRGEQQSLVAERCKTACQRRRRRQGRFGRQRRLTSTRRRRRAALRERSAAAGGGGIAPSARAAPGRGGRRRSRRELALLLGRQALVLFPLLPDFLLLFGRQGTQRLVLLAADCRSAGVSWTTCPSAPGRAAARPGSSSDSVARCRAISACAGRRACPSRGRAGASTCFSAAGGCP